MFWDFGFQGTFSCSYKEDPLIDEQENEVVRQHLHKLQHLRFSNVISLEESGDVEEETIQGMSAKNMRG